MPGHRFLALVALLGCVAVGCSEAESDPPDDEPSRSVGDAPTAKQPEATEATEATERDVDVPTMPRRARKNTLKGAEAFVRHYIDLRNQASSTGETRRFMRLSHNCDGCTKYADLYKKVYLRGGYIKSTGWVVQFLQAYDLGQATTVLVTVKAPRMRFKRDADDRTHIGRGGRYKLRFKVKRINTGWAVTYFGVQEDCQ